MSITNQKQELRQVYRQKRLAFSVEDHQKSSSSVCNLLRQTLKPFQPQVIAGYWPIQGEVDITPLLYEWHESGWTVCLPSLTQQKPALCFRAWTPQTILKPNCFTIPEPPADTPCHTPSILCIPCLAFDRHGYRLGYGKGYYDSYLDHTKNNQALKIGIAFSCQEHSLLPRDNHDYPLDLIVTEHEIIKPDIN